MEYTSPGYKPPTYYSPYDNRPRPRIEREGSKKYKTLEGAQKYIQSKYDEYAYLFMEVSPPIPQEAKMFFCVNGILLPGYTVENPERTPQEVADELLNFLDDEDAPSPTAPSQDTHKKSVPHKHRHNTPTR